MAVVKAKGGGGGGKIRKIKSPTKKNWKNMWEGQKNE